MLNTSKSRTKVISICKTPKPMSYVLIFVKQAICIRTKVSGQAQAITSLYVALPLDSRENTTIKLAARYAHLAAYRARHYIEGEYSESATVAVYEQRKWKETETKNSQERSITLKESDSDANFALGAREGRTLVKGHSYVTSKLKPHKYNMGQCLNEQASPPPSSSARQGRKW